MTLLWRCASSGWKLGTLESLPETHSLSLEASSPNASGAVQINPDNVSRHDWGDGEPCCRGLFPSFTNGASLF
jgi:hypothetical protein